MNSVRFVVVTILIGLGVMSNTALARAEVGSDRRLAQSTTPGSSAVVKSKNAAEDEEDEEEEEEPDCS